MKASGRPGRRPDGGGEDGNVAVLVAVMMLVFVGVAAVALDLGAGWAAKRALVTDIDAAALAGAMHLAASEDECVAGDDEIEDAAEDAAEHVYLLNGTPSDNVEFDARCHNMTVFVTESGRDVMRIFATERLAVSGSAMAKGVPAFGERLIPLTLCAARLPEGWAGDDPPLGASETVEFVIEGERTCATDHDSPGRWGWFGSTDEDELMAWLADENTMDDSDIETCTTAVPVAAQPACPGIPGPGDLLLTEGLAELECVEEDPAFCPIVTIMIHNTSRENRLRPTGFLDVVIRAVATTAENGEDDGDALSPSITLELRSTRWGPGAAASGGPTSHLCRVDGMPEDDDACD